MMDRREGGALGEDNATREENEMFRTCKVAFIGVLLAIVPVEKSVLWAADAKANSTAPKKQSSSYTGKIVVVDRAAKTVTVEIEKRLYLLKLSPSAKILRKGRKVAIAEVLTGQEVTVELVEAAEGQVLVAKLTIGPAQAESEPAEPAGNSDTGNYGRDNHDGNGRPGPGGPPVSPYN
jgi:hypothetical protein